MDVYIQTYALTEQQWHISNWLKDIYGSRFPPILMRGYNTYVRMDMFATTSKTYVRISGKHC